MKIGEIYSHLNGLEFLEARKQQQWKQIKSVIAKVDASKCRGKISKEQRMKGKVLYGPKLLNAAFKKEFSQLGWKSQQASYYVSSSEKLNRQIVELSPKEQKLQIEKAGLVPRRSYNQTDFVKDRIAVEVQFGKYSFIAYDLFVKHMAFFVSGAIDVGIEVIPMKSLQKDMSSGPGYFENELFNLVRQGRGVPPVPLVVIGLEP